MAEEKKTEKKPAAPKTAAKKEAAPKTAEKKTAAKPAAKKETAKPAAKPAAKKEAAPKAAAKPAAKKEAAPKASKPAAKKETKTWHIAFDNDKNKWGIRAEENTKATKFFKTKEEAEAYAKTLKANNEGSRIVFHKKDGKFQKK